MRLAKETPLSVPRWEEEPVLPELEVDRGMLGESAVLPRLTLDMPVMEEARAQVETLLTGKAPKGAKGLDPAFAAALARANALFRQRFGKEFGITSAYRSPQQQRSLWDAYVARGKKGAPVAPPGRSRHEQGRAVDIAWSALSKEQQDYLRQLLPSLGIEPPSWRFHYNSEPWHWEWQGG